MIMDKLLELDLAYTLTGTHASLNSIDLLKAGDALDGSELYLVARVGTVLASAGKAAVLKISLQCDEDSAFGSTKELCSVTLLEAACTKNTVVAAIKIPKGCERYVRGYYTVTTENFTGGTIDLFITPNIDVTR